MSHARGWLAVVPSAGPGGAVLDAGALGGIVALGVLLARRRRPR